MTKQMTIVVIGSLKVNSFTKSVITPKTPTCIDGHVQIQGRNSPLQKLRSERIKPLNSVILHYMHFTNRS